MTMYLPEPGQLVMARKRPFVVMEITPSSTTQAGALPQHLVKLSSVEDDGLGDTLDIIWELEPGTSVRDKAQLPAPHSFDHPSRLQAFLNAVRWGAVSPLDDKVLQSPFRSGIEVDEYQLDPVVRALTMPRVNLLIADDVGLGKTIEAGLVLQELMLRHRARSVLIVCPSSLQVQWQEEMRDKFGLEFRIVDSESISQLRRKRGIHINPWNHFPRLITSIDYLKRERTLRSLRETLPSGEQAHYPRAWDMLIVDEAHNIAPSGRGKYATDSQRTQAIRALAAHFEHKLFLSATPHNGYRESFASLLELLDNQRFARAVTPDRAQLEAVMVRRMKSELKARWDGSPRFAERVVQHLEVAYSAEERAAHRALQEYTRLRLARLASQNSDGERMATEFVLKLLKKRLFSSPAAFLTTLEKHIANLSARQSVQHQPSAAQTQRDISEFIDTWQEDCSDDDAYETEGADMVAALSQSLSALNAEERSLLQELQNWAESASQHPDSKARTLIDWLKQTLRQHGTWNRERVILFTEYRATQKWVYELLAHAGFAADGALEMIYGGMDNEQRERIKAAFQADPDEAPVRILLATDAASEGVNLQNHCAKLIHLEIPWNPNRMEQRNGRVDRHGQKAPQVDIYHFVGSGFEQVRPQRADQGIENFAEKSADKFADLAADLEFLMRAALKVETIREDLGKVGPVIASQVEQAMLGKRKALDTARAEREAEPVRQMLKFERKLREQLAKLHSQLRDTQQELNLTPEQVENVVHVALDLAGQPPLQPTELPGIWPDPTGTRRRCPVFHLPPLSSSWALCSDGLAHPHSKRQRPIVFDATLANGRDDVVLAHLNHRLVQMSLRLLRAEIWSQGGKEPTERKHLARVAACVVPDAQLARPTLIAHARIVVLGGDNFRLHEEVIAAGGEIVEGRLQRLNVGQTRAALAAMSEQAAPPEIEQRLQKLWDHLAPSLHSALEARCTERTKNLQSLLNELAEKEVNKLTTILHDLQRNIEAELDAKDGPQLLLDLGDDAQGHAQRERDLAALRQRLAGIPAEIEREAAHIRARYANPSARLFPVAVTWLMPRHLVPAGNGGKP